MVRICPTCKRARAATTSGRNRVDRQEQPSQADVAVPNTSDDPAPPPDSASVSIPGLDAAGVATLRVVANQTWDSLRSAVSSLTDATVYNGMVDAQGAGLVNTGDVTHGRDDSRNDGSRDHEGKAMAEPNTNNFVVAEDQDQDSDTDEDDDEDDDEEGTLPTAQIVFRSMLPGEGPCMDEEDQEGGASSRPPPRKAHVERHLEPRVRFLTVAQRCWDWFNQRPYHCTSSLACTLGAFGRKLITLPRDSPELMKRFAHEFMRLCKGWHGRHRGNRFTEMGTDNEEHIFTWLSLETPFVSLFDVGLVESRQHSWLACSADAVAIVRLSALPLPSVQESLGLDVSNDCIVPVEMKTFCSPSTITLHERVAATSRRGWLACNASDTLEFRRCIPSQSHRCQVLHQAAVFDSPLTVYVCATEDGILYRVLIRTPQTVRDAHIKWLEVICKPLFWWMYDSVPATPAYVPIAAAEVMESHHTTWWAVRQHVLSFGPLPPVHQLRPALVHLYNQTMGGIGTLLLRGGAFAPCASPTMFGVWWAQTALTERRHCAIQPRSWGPRTGKKPLFFLWCMSASYVTRPGYPVWRGVGNCLTRIRFKASNGFSNACGPSRR